MTPDSEQTTTLPSAHSMNATIFDLSWNQATFRSKLKLILQSRRKECERIRSSDPQTQAEGYSALSSTYYSIVGTAKSQLTWSPFSLLLWCFTWAPLGAFCYMRMLSLSNKVVRLIGYANMSVNQCDIRQSILLARSKHIEARNCIYVALGKNLENVKPYTLGLLYVGLAETFWRDGNRPKVQKSVIFALEQAAIAESSEPAQACRIYRKCAKLHAALGNTTLATMHAEHAKRLAESVGAEDQILKASRP